MAKYIKTEEGYKDLEESVSKIVDPVEAELFNKMNKTNPTGTGSFSLNRKANTPIGNSSFAEGYDTTASGNNSHAEGNTTTSSGYSSHAEGWNTTASGSYSHAEGANTTASWYGSHAEGANTTASSYYSHAEGSYTKASGDYSHAEGSYTKASGDYSHAEGAKTTASGDYSHAEGSYTTASGYRSHSEGQSTAARGKVSHAEGDTTIASGESSHVQGKYNVEDTSNKYADIIGNGTNTKRSNAATVDWTGNAWYAGDVYTGSTSGTNRDEGSKKLATEEYVGSIIDAAINEVTHTDAETLNLLIEEDMLPAVYITNGKILTDQNGNIVLRY